MIIVVDESIFVNSDIRDCARLALLRLAAQRHHALVCQKVPHPRGAVSEPCPLRCWCERLSGRTKREAVQMLESLRFSAMGTDRGSCRLLISQRWERRNDCVLPLDTALRVLSEPLHVLVENALRDSAFLRRVMSPEWRAELSKWEGAGRLRFEHGGGIDEMRGIVEFMTTDEGASASWGMPASAWRQIHFAVSDHDGSSSDMPSNSARMLKDACVQACLSARLHVLRRKRQEHYLPRAVMERLATTELSDPQTRADTLQAIQVFFADDRCFGRLPQLPSEGFWKARFWKHRAETWNDAWFQEDGAYEEMTMLAEALARVL